MATGTDMNAATSVKSAYATLAAQKHTGSVNALNGKNAKAWQAAQDFESVFLNSMFSQMFTSIEGDGPFGGGKAVGVWRSFLTDEYSKSFAKNGGIGIASDVYRALMAQQETATAAAQAATTETNR